MQCLSLKQCDKVLIERHDEGHLKINVNNIIGTYNSNKPPRDQRARKWVGTKDYLVVKKLWAPTQFSRNFVYWRNSVLSTTCEQLTNLMVN
jgi:hypothetical protein